MWKLEKKNYFEYIQSVKSIIVVILYEYCKTLETSKFYKVLLIGKPIIKTDKEKEKI